MSRSKAWPVVDWGVHELIIVNMFLIARVADKRQYGEQSAFRWQIICEVLSYCDQLDGQTAEPVTDQQRQEVVGRFHPESVRLHHRVSFSEYVTADELTQLHELHDDDPHPPTQKRARKADGNRKDKDGRQLFRNPFWHSSVCVVCWAGITAKDRADPAKLRKKLRPTSFYCRECSLESRWTYRVRVGKSFHRYHPRLCSQKCFEIFHTREIFGLDHHQRARQKQRRSRRMQRTTTTTTPQPVRRNRQQAPNVSFDV